MGERGLGTNFSWGLSLPSPDAEDSILVRHTLKALGEDGGGFDLLDMDPRHARVSPGFPVLESL